MGRRCMALAMVMAFVLMALGAPVRAASDSLDGGGSEDQGTASKLGWGMASVGINLGYMPVKMIYALGGGLVGLLAWGFTAGDDNVLYGILDPAWGGTWAVTPENLSDGDNHPIMFSGPTYKPET